jgi:hypothetical protein
MSDREILLHWLATAAARLGWRRRVRELGWFACALAALCLLAEVLEALGVAAPALAASARLLLVAALAVVALFAWLITRPTTLAEAARAADTRAGLKDELKSAHWFAQRAAREALVELLLTRAAQTAQGLDARRLFPVGLPRSALVALALAVLVGCLAWFSPRIALPVGPQVSASAPAGDGQAQDAGISESKVDKGGAHSASADAEPRPVPSAAWSQLERLAKELPVGTERETIRQAVSARDARLAAQLLQASERSRAAAVPQEPNARSQRELKLAVEAQRLLETLQGAFNPQTNPPSEPSTKAEISPTVRTLTQLREQVRQERRKIIGQPAQGEVTQNNRLRAISRSGAGVREVAYGEGEAADAGSRASVSGAAAGERTGRSQSGGSEGESPNNTPTGAADDSPVLGERTERLAAQVDKMKLKRDDDPQQRDTEEEFYAATQRQASEVEYESISARWRAQRETVLPPSGTPLSYREAVKQYFLSQHGKED